MQKLEMNPKRNNYDIHITLSRIRISFHKHTNSPLKRFCKPRIIEIITHPIIQSSTLPDISAHGLKNSYI